MNKKIFTLLFCIILFAVIYRVLPNRIAGFNPMYAISLFSGFVFAKNKKYTFLTPIIAMLLSDVVYEILFRTGLGTIPGFYGWGQILQYLSIAAIALVGTQINKVNALQIGGFGVIGATVFFILSNFFVWVEGMGYEHSYTFGGLMKCFADGVPFYKATVLSTVLFSAVLFSTYNFIVEGNKIKQKVK